jgi:hypothetical protein
MKSCPLYFCTLKFITCPNLSSIHIKLPLASNITGPGAGTDFPLGLRRRFPESHRESHRVILGAGASKSTEWKNWRGYMPWKPKSKAVKENAVTQDTEKAAKGRNGLIRIEEEGV